MAAGRKGGLGRGLGALLEDVNAVVAKTGPAESQPAEGLNMLSADLLKPNAQQPRKHFDREKITELAESIRLNGLLQPILVRRSGEGYEIVAGERRWRAAREAGLKELPCIVRDLDDEQNLLIAIIENLQREGLDPIEEAEAFRGMAERFGMSQDEVAKSVGKSRPYVANALRLLKLPEPVRERVSAGELSAGHARALLSIRDEKKLQEAAKRMAEEGWSVRQAERFAAEKKGKAAKGGKKGAGAKRPQEIRDLEEDLKKRLGTKVSIRAGRQGGKILIECFSREELERILELLGSLEA